MSKPIPVKTKAQLIKGLRRVILETCADREYIRTRAERLVMRHINNEEVWYLFNIAKNGY